MDNAKRLLEDLLKGNTDRAAHYLNKLQECRTAKDVAYEVFLPLVSEDGLAQEQVRRGKLPKVIVAAINAHHQQHTPGYKPITPKNRSFYCIQALAEWEKEQAEKAEKRAKAQAEKRAEEQTKQEAEEKPTEQAHLQADSEVLAGSLMMLVDPKKSEHPENINLFMKIIQSSAHKLGVSLSQYHIHSSSDDATTEKRISDRHTAKRPDDQTFDIAQGFHPAGARSQPRHRRLYTDIWGRSRLALSA